MSPSFRNDLKAQNPRMSTTFSMWFDQPPKAANGTFRGTLLIGALPPKEKYSGKLVGIQVDNPEEPYLGYYVSVPKISVRSLAKPKAAAKTVKTSDASVKRCLVDSGFGQDTLAIDEGSLLDASGLIRYDLNGVQFIAYNGTCDSIPKNATLDFSFPAVKGGSVTIGVPIRNYARGTLDEFKGASKDVCGLSIAVGEIGDCFLGAPFFSAAVLAFGDNPSQVAIAQGGISKGQRQGPAGMGKVKVIKPGHKLLDAL